MQILLEPTDRFMDVDGARTRLWKGTTGSGLRIVAFIASIAAPTDDPRTEAELAIELQELPPLKVDVRLFRPLLD